MRAALLRCFFAGGMLLGGASTGWAAAPWGPLQPIGTAPVQNVGVGPDVAVGSAASLVAFQAGGSTLTGAFVSTITGAGTPTLTPLDTLGSAASVATDATGAGVLAWVGHDGVYAVIRSTDGALSAPTRVLEVPPDRSVRALDLDTAGVAPNGGRRAVLVAILDNHQAYAQGGPTGAVHAARLSGATWSPSTRLASGLRNPLQVDTAGTSSGGAAAVWSDRGQGTDGRVFAARMTAAGVWRDFGAIASRTADDVAIAVDETGAGTVAWVQRGPGPDRLLTRERRSLGGYGTAVQVATGNIDRLGLASDAAGRVTMAWVRRIGAEYRLQHASRPARGTWSTVGVLTVTPRRVPGVALASNQRGDVLVAWSAHQGKVVDHYARYRRAGAGFGARELLAGPLAASSMEAPSVALGVVGHATTVVGAAGATCCVDLSATTRTTAPAPIVTEVAVSPTRVRAVALRVRFRQSRSARVVITIRVGLEQHPLVVRTVAGRAGANTVLFTAAELPGRPGRYTVTVGPTVGPREPDVLTTSYQRVAP